MLNNLPLLLLSQLHNRHNYLNKYLDALVHEHKRHHIVHGAVARRHGEHFLVVEEEGHALHGALHEIIDIAILADYLEVLPLRHVHHRLDHFILNDGGTLQIKTCCGSLVA